MSTGLFPAIGQADPLTGVFRDPGAWAADCAAAPGPAVLQRGGALLAGDAAAVDETPAEPCTAGELGAAAGIAGGPAVSGSEVYERPVLRPGKIVGYAAAD